MGCFLGPRAHFDKRDEMIGIGSGLIAEAHGCGVLGIDSRARGCDERVWWRGRGFWRVVVEGSVLSCLIKVVGRAADN